MSYHNPVENNQKKHTSLFLHSLTSYDMAVQKHPYRLAAPRIYLSALHRCCYKKLITRLFVPDIFLSILVHCFFSYKPPSTDLVPFPIPFPSQPALSLPLTRSLTLTLFLAFALALAFSFPLSAHTCTHTHTHTSLFHVPVSFSPSSRLIVLLLPFASFVNSLIVTHSQPSHTSARGAHALAFPLLVNPVRRCVLARRSTVNINNN